MLKPAVTVQYPHEREDPPTRARGVIALKEENCTACMLCPTICPAECIHIEAGERPNKEKYPVVFHVRGRAYRLYQHGTDHRTIWVYRGRLRGDRGRPPLGGAHVRGGLPGKRRCNS